MTTNRKFSGEFTDFEAVKMELSKARIQLKTRRANLERNQHNENLSARYIDGIRAEIASLEEKIPKLETILVTEPPLPELPPRQPLFKVSGVLEEFSVQKVIGYFTAREYAPEEFAREEASDQVGSLLLAITGNAAGSAVTGQSKVRQDDRCDFVRGKINGVLFHGWLGKTHVRVGDYVEMVVMNKDEHYLVYAIMFPALRTLSITPRCRCGREADIRFGLTYGMPVLASIFLIMLIVFFFQGMDWKGLAICAAMFGAILLVVFGYAAWKIKRQPGPVFLLAENIFSTLGFANPQYVDLRTLTKVRIKELSSGSPSLTDRDLPSRCSAWVNYFYYY
ncbi:putative type VI secretion system effector [Pseudescherichia vulneris]|uniref:putative type VI secretion system effector n=1 Tax=Pseudescherichia vulneris TaxID=566 RepID=UPI0028B0FAF2|nr:putative type VI secretion system effector [Pseudescherichia vulneris]